MSFPVVTNSGTGRGYIGTGLIYSNAVYFPIMFTNTSRVVSWTVPPGITTVRVRLWGGGGGTNNGLYSQTVAGGGGFAIKTVTGLTPGSTVPVTVGRGSPINNGTGTGATSSFGAYVSATGGRNNQDGTTLIGGVGVGGDVNAYGGGGGPDTGGNVGGMFIPYSGYYNDQPGVSLQLMGTPINPLDKIGTQSLFGTDAATPGRGGFGTQYNALTGPTYPGGGCQTYYWDGNGSYQTVGIGGAGLVIVEY